MIFKKLREWRSVCNKAITFSQEHTDKYNKKDFNVCANEEAQLKRIKESIERWVLSTKEIRGKWMKWVPPRAKNVRGKEEHRNTSKRQQY